MEIVPAHLLYIFVFALGTGLAGDYWSGVHGHPILLEAPTVHTLNPAQTGHLSCQSVVCLACEVFTWLPQEAGWKSTRAWWDLVTVYRAIVTAALPSSQPARHSIIISSGKLRKRV